MRRWTLLSILLLPAFLVAFPALADNYPRSATLDALHYRLTLELKENSDELRGETEILFAAAADGLKEVKLDFAGMVVDRAAENGQTTDFRRAGERLLVVLRGDYRRGDQLRISVQYHGQPSEGLIIRKNKFGRPTFFADNWPDRAHHWFPAVDHPYDKATVEFLVTSPDRFDVIANGSLLETSSRQDGTKLWHWSETTPIPTYCMVFGAAEFSILQAGSWNGIPLIYYLYPADRDKGLRDYGRAPQMVEFYSNLIGPFPYEKLALVQSSTRYGGMENSGSIFFAEAAYDGSGNLEGTVAHEVAHQWFGDSVTEADWHHLWLSESFATYFGHLFFERADGRDAFLASMRADREVYLGQYDKNPRPIHDPEVTELTQLLNANNYQKGSWVLHMLRHLLGDASFYAGIREYYRTYRDRNALTDDLQRIMERHAGKPLDWFFKQWIFEAGHPVYEATWSWSERSKEVHLRLRQQQPGVVFRMPIDVELRKGTVSRREVIQTTEREQSFTFRADAKPDLLLLDPEDWVLKVLTMKAN